MTPAGTPLPGLILALSILGAPAHASSDDASGPRIGQGGAGPEHDSRFGGKIGSPGAPMEPVPATKTYEECLDLAAKRPEDGFEAAIAWKGDGAGPAADHCAAVALFGLGQFEESARRLEVLGHQALVEPDVKAGLFAQAGLAWLRSNHPHKATKALSAAVTLAPADPQILIDRARAWAARNDFASAENDLSGALNLNPASAEAFALRAAARRFLDRREAAFSDAVTALKINPGHPGALLERGILYRLSGLNDKARRDWLRLLDTAPESAAAELARKNIELMDMRPEGEPIHQPPPRR